MTRFSSGINSLAAASAFFLNVGGLAGCYALFLWIFVQTCWGALVNAVDVGLFIGLLS